MYEPEDWPLDDEDPEPRDPPTCDRCGTRDLEWVDIGGGRWRLYKGLKPHVCPRLNALDAFKNI